MVMKKSIITIGGPPGSGKSTIAKRTADRLGYDHYSSGDFMREMAKDRGLTLEELSKKAETNPEIDKKIDARNKKLADKTNIVVDSRLAFYFIPDSFSVYLDVSFDEAARRIYSDEHKKRATSGEDHNELKPLKKDIAERLASEKKRYHDLYHIDHTNHKHYDLIIDTDTKDIATVTQIVLDEYDENH